MSEPSTLSSPQTHEGQGFETGLVLEAVKISLHDKLLVDLTLHVEPRQVVTVMGESGAGKSSLLAFAGGFLGADFKSEGRVWLNGSELTFLPLQQRRMGVLFQDPLLFPHLSVGQNLAFGLPPKTKNKVALIAKALQDVGLDGYEHRDPATLSGGQKARVALMRVLLSDPSALLLDEPFSKLDVELRKHIRSLVFQAADRRGLPVLLVTHDPMDAEAAGGPVIDLSKSQ